MSNCSHSRIDWNSTVLCFKHGGINICPICEASLIHHINMGNLVAAYTCVTYISISLLEGAGVGGGEARHRKHNGSLVAIVCQTVW